MFVELVCADISPEAGRLLTVQALTLAISKTFHTVCRNPMGKFLQTQKIIATLFRKVCLLACSVLLLSLPIVAEELAAGTALEVRLSSATGSRISHRGEPIEATIIAPVSVHERILIPQGSKLLGSIANATPIGFGIKHFTATLAYAFDMLQLPSGARIPVNTQVAEVETAKENVDDRGTVDGIHPVASISSSLSYYTIPFLFIDPIIGAPVWCIKSLVAPPANPEIRFPTGTELILRLTTAVTLPAGTDFRAPAKPFSRGDLNHVERLLKNSAQRAYMGDRASDLVNVLLIGSRSQIDRAFHAAGWLQAERKSPLSLYRLYHALAERYGYPRAPMNALTLNGVSSAFVYQKSLDTVEKRHHVRFWHYPGHSDIWLGTAAEDVGFRFKLTHWTHATDPHIDRERDKVVNDLAFTGCLDAAGLLPRVSADLGQDPKAEHPIVTDGDVAVIRLNDCIHPNLMAGVGEIRALHQRGRLANTLAAFQHELVRSNIVFTTYNTLRFVVKHKAGPRTMHALLNNGESRGLAWLTAMTPPQSRPDSDAGSSPLP